MSRRVYLDEMKPEDALTQLFAALAAAGGLVPAGETVRTVDARGRILHAAAYARRSSPHYHAAAMDGIAVRAADTFGAAEATPVRLRVGAGCQIVDTGDPLPAGTDAVIMIEDCHPVDGETFEIIAAAAPWQHVRTIGEDLVATEMVLPSGQYLDGPQLGALLAGGVNTVTVRRRPVVAIIPTGDELVPAEDDPPAGMLPEYNTVTIGGAAETWGGIAVRRPIVRDLRADILAATRAALAEADIVVINAGSSAGRDDHTASVIAELGQVLAHGIAIRPGKPTVVGIAGGKPVLGLPGYPVSALLAAELFLKPLIARALGTVPAEPETVTAVLTRRATSPMGLDEYVRVKVGLIGSRFVATPLPRGASLITSLTRADGIALIPRTSEGCEAGQEITVRLLVPRRLIERTLVSIGSHDVAVDILDDMLRQAEPGTRVSSSHVGSLGGLLALRRGECHLSTSHLLDEQTGEYNVSFIRRYLPGQRVALITLAHRLQGLIVRAGNPKRISDFADLVRPDVTYVNRQKGSGTRVLLDYELGKRGLDPAAIAGYEREEFTHLAVAAAVAGGSADAGLGVCSAARALELDFVPVGEEDYQLVIPAEQFEQPLVQRLLQLAASDEFRRRLTELGGYRLPERQEVRWVNA
ncbi:MAG: molybdopterin biosynthesis protein [Chloroflexota bacterium]